MVREAEQRDLDAILELYLFLHEDSIPEMMKARRKQEYRLYRIRIII